MTLRGVSTVTFLLLPCYSFQNRADCPSGHNCGWAPARCEDKVCCVHGQNCHAVLQVQRTDGSCEARKWLVAMHAPSSDLGWRGQCRVDCAQKRRTAVVGVDAAGVAADADVGARTVAADVLADGVDVVAIADATMVDGGVTDHRRRGRQPVRDRKEPTWSSTLLRSDTCHSCRESGHRDSESRDCLDLDRIDRNCYLASTPHH